MTSVTKSNTTVIAIMTAATAKTSTTSTTINTTIIDLITLFSIYLPETFTYPRLLVGLGSVKGRKLILTPKVKERVLRICVIYDTFVMVLPFVYYVTCL